MAICRSWRQALSRGLKAAQCDLDKDLQYGSLHSYEGLVSQAVFRVFIIDVASSENFKSIIVRAVVNTVHLWTDKLHG